jgi:hypothetical protein
MDMNKTDEIINKLNADRTLTSKQLAEMTGASLGHARRTRGRFFKTLKDIERRKELAAEQRPAEASA